MKQHITKEQWDELNGEQKRTIQQARCDKGCFGHASKEYPNIGQMIEFLGEEQYLSPQLGRTWVAGWWEELFYADWVDCGCGEPHDTIIRKTYDGELCNALWEAIKNKLDHTL